MSKHIIILGNSDPWHIIFRYPLIQELTKSGYKVTVLLQHNNSKTIKDIKDLGANTHFLPFSRTGLNPFKDLQFVLQLRKYLKTTNPSHLFLYNAKCVAFGSIVARMLNITNCYSLITGLGYAFIGKSFKKNLVRKFLSFLYKKGLTHNKVVFFQNPDDELFFKDHNIITHQQKTVRVFGSGVDIKEFPFIPYKKGKFRFLMLARLLKEKGVLEYAQAAKQIRKKYPNVECFIAGALDPNPASISKETIQKWESEKSLHYLGSIQDVQQALSDSAVYILPSYREGCPRSSLEAMAIGRPIITTDAPGCRETVIEGENGFLVPIKNPEALANAMEKFIQNPDLIAKMGAASRKLAEDKFDVKKVNKIILDTIQSLPKNPS